VNIAEPILVEDHLYWLGGIGVIYKIDLNGDFTPDKITSMTIDEVGEAWTFGKMAYQDGYLYVRSQKNLFKIKVAK
ncbi:MAG: hypothetical protein NE330_07545, partial [Lentisphaeraceae bacterium]|nr:hypothetical protein [Lentisphaeraceae bacterium]